MITNRTMTSAPHNHSIAIIPPIIDPMGYAFCVSPTNRFTNPPPHGMPPDSASAPGRSARIKKRHVGDRWLKADPKS